MIHARAIALVLLALLGALSLTAPLAAQNVLSEGDMAVATTNGVYILHYKDQAVRVMAGPLEEPGIEWCPGSDDLYLVSDNRFLRVTVMAFATNGATVQTLATLPVGTRLTDLDVDHTTGDVWLLDRSTDQALRFTAPVSQGASPDLVLQLDDRSRALSVDSSNHPFSLVYASTNGLMRQTLTGPPEIESYQKGGVGASADTSWQHAGWGSFFANHDTHGIYLDVYNSSGADIILQFPSTPYIFHPTDVEWLPNSGKVYVTSHDGVSPGYFPTLQTTGTGVHVVEFRPGGTGLPGGILPAVIVSDPQGQSLVFGTDPDLTIIADGAFAGPYGDPTPAYSGETPVLTTASYPELGNSAFALQILGGPPQRPVYAGLSRAPANIMVGHGVQLIQSPLWIPVGFTDPPGDLLVPAAVPNNPALTSMVLYTQAVVFGEDFEPAFTNALVVHFR